MKVFYAQGLAALMVVAATPVVAAPPGEAMLTCTNPYSGATWQIKIDYEKGTVDSNAAEIGTTEISWHDPRDGGNYTLDRTTGKLTIVVASATGGYFLYDTCLAKN